MEKKFEIGNCVILKSGGPTMTVTKHVGTTPLRGASQYSGKIDCTWFFENELKFGTFPQDTLEIDE